MYLKDILNQLEIETDEIYLDLSKVPKENIDDIYLFYASKDKDRKYAMYNNISENKKTFARLELVKKGDCEFLGAVRLPDSQSNIPFIMSEIIHLLSKQDC